MLNVSYIPSSVQALPWQEVRAHAHGDLSMARCTSTNVINTRQPSYTLFFLPYGPKSVGSPGFSFKSCPGQFAVELAEIMAKIKTMLASTSFSIPIRRISFNILASLVIFEGKKKKEYRIARGRQRGV